MTEQGQSCGSTCCNITYGYHCPNPPSTWQGVTQGNGTSSGGIYWSCVRINGNPPVVGDTFRDSTSNNGVATGNGHVYEVLAISLPSSATYHRNFLDDLSCSIPGCTDSIATNYDPTATVDDGSCTYDPTDCTKANWLGHINTNYPQINDPSTNLQLAHFCEYCNDGTIPPMTDSFCKCCDPIEPCQPPKGGCIPPLTWDQAACKCERGIAPIREEVLRMKKLANIKIDRLR